MQRRTLFLAALVLPWLAPPLAARAQVPAPDAPAEKAGEQVDSRSGLRVSLEQMHESLAGRFPMRLPVAGLMELAVQTPALQLRPQENRLRAALPVQASGPALPRSQSGSLDVDMALRYEASDRTLRAHRLRLSRLRFPGLPPRVEELLNQYAPALAEQALQEVVLHQLEPQDLRMLDAMGMQPGEITVTDTGLLIGLVLKPL